MKDDNKTKKQLVHELTELRSQNAALEKSMNGIISAELAAEGARRYAESIVETVREPLLVLDADLKIISANRNFYTTFKVIPGETIGCFIYDLGNKQWDIPMLRELLEEVLPEKQAFDDFEVDHNFQDIGRKIMLLNACRIYRKEIGANMILLAIEDITERKRLESLLIDSEEQYRRLFETASDGIVLLEKREGTITNANPATEKLLGYNQKESIGNKLQDIGVSLDMGDFQTTMQNLNKSGIINYRNVKVETKSGQHIDTEIYLVDRAKLVQCNIRDITERKQAKEALLRSEDKFRTIFDKAGDGILIADAITKKLLQGNNAICSMLGYTKKEIESLTITDIHRPIDISHVLDEFEKQRKGEKVLAEDLPVLRKDGSIFYADISASSVIIGGVHCLLGIFRDITERKQAEAEQKASKDFIEAVLDNLHDSLLVIDPINYTILRANKIFLNSCGLNKDTVIGKYCYELSHNISTPCSHPDHICPLAETIKTKKPSTEEHIHYDSTGSKLYVEVSTIPIISKGGEIHHVIHFSRDITERKRAEETLQKTNLKLFAIIDNLPFLAWLKDSEGRFMAVNEPFAHSCGLSSTDDLVGKTDFDIWPKHLAEAYRADDFEVMRARQKKAVEELIADQGVQKWFETYKAPLYELDGNVIGTTGFSRDITERKQAEKRLQQTLDSLRNAVNTTIQVLVSAVETRDPYTAGHQIRSADLAGAIATEMGLSQENIQGIRMASSIHDIGKLSIPAEILSKPTKLSEIEFSLIKEHARRGFEMLKDVESVWPLAEIIYQHHERMDGSGYPRNLKGNDILMEARILAVSDVVESMASHRPHRPGLGIGAALNEIEKIRGICYDNTVADACLKLFREKGFQLSET